MLRATQHEAAAAQLQAEEAVRSSEAELAALRVSTNQVIFDACVVVTGTRGGGTLIRGRAGCVASGCCRNAVVISTHHVHTHMFTHLHWTLAVHTPIHTYTPPLRCVWQLLRRQPGEASVTWSG